jgi:AAA domain
MYEQPFPLDTPPFVSYLAQGCLNMPARYVEYVRESVPEEHRDNFNLFLKIATDREDKEREQSLAALTKDAHARLLANDGAKRLRQEDEAAQRGHVSTRILDYAQLLQLPSPQPLIWNVAYTGAVGIVLGDSQTGKTWVSLSFAASAACGRHWPAYRPYPRPDPIGVLYVAAEDGGSIGKRLKMWESAHEESLAERIFHVHPSAIDVLDSVQIDELADTVRDRGYRLIVIDTVAASLGGEEEGNAEFSRMVRHMRLLVDAMNGLGSVFLVHHFGKDKTKGARGGSSLFNDADIVWELHGTLDEMEMKCAKWKSDSLRQPWFLHLERHDREAVHIAQRVPTADSSAAVADSAFNTLTLAVVDIVKAKGRENQGFGPTRNVIKTTLRANQITFRTADLSPHLEWMVSEGRLVLHKGPNRAQCYRLPTSYEQQKMAEFDD